ncbi:MAG: hypothetical protein ACI35V_07095 [Sphingobacterium composti]|uniref:hypothetical protein n=1 Tax=Sphingobacterium composti TaxID=363260 RepID=UPI00135902CD|nr:hypothetical protein [Sphingobacterium composti Ten et al. 2007 non Yoo et al. 2007]
MNYKFLFTFFVSILVSSAVSANEPVEDGPTQYRSLRNFTKWFSSVNVGTQFYLGDHDKQESMFKRLTPNFEISAGKWLNQSFGVRAGINGFKMKGLTKEGPLATSKEMVIGSPHFLYDQEFNFINVHADLLFHWTNDALDIDLNRMYSLIPYGGIGIIAATNKQKTTNLTMNFGLIQTFRINNKLDFNIDVKGNIMSDSFDGEKGGNNFEGNGIATIGLTYNFR